MFLHTVYEILGGNVAVFVNVWGLVLAIAGGGKCVVVSE